jgi:hypothetical protein
MSRVFEDAGEAPETGAEVAEQKLAVSAEPESIAKKRKRKKQRSQEWSGDIAANEYLMMLYR